MSLAGGRFRTMILGMRDGERLCHVVALCEWFKMLVARGEGETACLNALKTLRKDIMRLRGDSLVRSTALNSFMFVPEDSYVFGELDKVGFEIGKLDPWWWRNYAYEANRHYSASEYAIIEEDDYNAAEEEWNRRIVSSSEDPVATLI